MKCQILFSGKKKREKKYFNMLSAKNFTQHKIISTNIFKVFSIVLKNFQQMIHMKYEASF